MSEIIILKIDKRKWRSIANILAIQMTIKFILPYGSSHKFIHIHVQHMFILVDSKYKMTLERRNVEHNGLLKKEYNGYFGPIVSYLHT
jgi:hypothetical protein